MAVRIFAVKIFYSLLGLLLLANITLAGTDSAISPPGPNSPGFSQGPPSQANHTKASPLSEPHDAFQVRWQRLEPGLELAEIDTATMKNGICVLKISPQNFNFVLCSISDDDGTPKTLSEWGDHSNLVAAINASMYLPDGVTSTGYMKNSHRLNNARIADRFGAFFVADPVHPGLPAAAIIERDNPAWRQLIEKYRIVVQNYRMTNSQGKILWRPGGPEYAISAVAEDANGNILFLHSREPVDAHAFAEKILSLPLGIKTMMYVEGGAQAGLLLRTAQVRREISGQHAISLLVTGNSSARLPNVIGVKRKMH